MSTFRAEIQTQTGWGRTLELFAAWCAPQPGWRALDVGCGPGLLPEILQRSGCTALGVDLDLDLLRGGERRPNLAQAEAGRLPFPDYSFDLLTASNLLFFLPEPAIVLNEMARALRPSGQVCLLNPSEQMSVAAAMEVADAHHLDGLARRSLLDWAARAEANARWDGAELAALCAAAGLRLVETALRIGPGLARLARAVPAEA